MCSQDTEAKATAARMDEMRENGNVLGCTALHTLQMPCLAVPSLTFKRRP